MGCLNDDKEFGHWFANVHLSGPCNRACYFCIGQHMMALDALNTLTTWPLPGWDGFAAAVSERGIKEAYITGSNTDPLIASNLPQIVEALRALGVTKVGVRTNGALAVRHPDLWALFDQVSLSVTSFNPSLYTLTMGRGAPPDLKAIQSLGVPVWANVVLCPETVESGDIIHTLAALKNAGIPKVNLREPYGQAHIGNPMVRWAPSGELFGNPVYNFHGMEVVYWDVHSTEVKSVNLYANGRVSLDYSVTKGHDEGGVVLDQSHFTSGRHRPQWVGVTTPE